MRASHVEETLKALFPMKRPVSLLGPPGGGKTSVVRKVALDMDVGYIEKHMPTMLVEDFGIPNVLSDKKYFEYKMPDWFPATDRDDMPEEGVLCFDDRNQASNDIQKVLANIQQARTLHGSRLKDGWMVISTGNRREDRAGANRVLSHLANRETVLEFESNIDDSTNWMLDNEVRPEVISFVNFRTDLLHLFDPDKDQNPTPRSWVEGVSPLLGKLPRHLEAECFKGAVGEGAASEFIGFLEIMRDLPDINKLIREPESGSIPEETSVRFAMVGSIAEKANEDNVSNVCRLANRFPSEFTVLLMSMMVRRDHKLARCKEYCEWALANKHLLGGA